MDMSADCLTKEAAAAHACDLCQGTCFAPVAQVDRHGDPLETVICTRCGLISHGRIPTAEELDRFYSVDYRRAYHGEITPSPRRVMRAWRKGELIHRRLADFMRSSDRVLEVGSGIGCTVKVFELAGFAAEGLEPNIGFCRFGANRLHAKLREGFLFDCPAEETFDVILLTHVIEHFRSPRQALDHMFQMLRPGGRLYLECPNVGAPFALPHKLFHVAHVYNFTAATLTMLARHAGFEVLTQFATPDDPNLRMLLIKTGIHDETIDPASYGQTLASLQRYNLVTYYLRSSYLRTRLSLGMRYVSEFLLAKSYVERRIALCEESLQQPSVTPNPVVRQHRTAA